MKKTIQVFLQKELNKILLALEQQQSKSTSPLTVNYSNCDESAHRGFQLLPAGLSASGFTAKPLGFDVCNGQTVYNHMLHKKQENEKALAKHPNGFELEILEKARAPIRTVRTRIVHRDGTATPLASCRRVRSMAFTI